MSSTPSTIEQAYQQALNAGNQAWSRGEAERALRCYGAAALIDPSQSQPHVNLGVVLRRMGKVAAAAASHRRALALAPDDPVIHSNLGNALREIGHLDQAVVHLRRAAQLKPENQSFACNLALALRDARHHVEARRILADLAARHPENGEYAWDLALTDLYALDYQAGFRGYESRWKLTRSPQRNFASPLIVPGQDLSGKTVLIAAEQGFGDSLQFARFLPEMVRRCGRVVLECQPELMDIFAAIPGIAAIFLKETQPPAHDCWIPIMSLALFLELRPNHLPGRHPYLRSPKDLPLPLAKVPGARLKIGLIWAGKTVPRDRSWPLDRLFPLLEDPRLAFYSLQMGPRAQDLKIFGADMLMRDMAPSIQSFADTAALMSAMDAIVTIDTSAAHLAGALGRPTLTLLRYVSDWRWLDQGEDNIWYPNMRLFRQTDPFDFDGPVLAVKAALDKMLAD